MQIKKEPLIPTKMGRITPCCHPNCRDELCHSYASKGATPAARHRGSESGNLRTVPTAHTNTASLEIQHPRSSPVIAH